MISSWATKRRLLYGGGFLIITALIVFGIFFKAVYKAPTCSDGLKNRDESGIDCGGSCVNICKADTLSPIVYWAKAFNVAGDVYNLAAYVDNPNFNSSNPKVQYEFNVYDASNILLGTRKGEISIPKNKKIVVFEPGFVIKNKTPKRVDFSFTAFSNWQNDTTLDPDISIKHTALLSTSTSPRVEGTISNLSTQNVDSVELVSTVLDSRDNVVAVSRTFVDNLVKKSSQDFVFTWPKPFNLGVEECTLPLDVAIVLDRSGSMQSEGVNPQEPFTTVKNTAKDFVKSLSSDDRVTLISFGTEATLNSELSSDKQKVISAIDNLSLSTTSAQTNIGDGLSSAFKELTSNQNGSKEVIIMLTDGVPTEPSNKNDIDYPVNYALGIAKDILAGKIDIYTIGLGKDVSGEFLTSISSESSHYFKAPSKENLTSIYKNISSSLCTKKPSVVNIIYRFIPSTN